MGFAQGKYDCIVVGGGHAGCEAASALARLGHLVLLVTGNVDRIGHLSCNPSIGGLAKGHMVREIDALGGRMGIWADLAGIQFRTLNASKGPAVRATRAQMDRDAYMTALKRDLFTTPNLVIWNDTVEGIISSGGRACGVSTQSGCRILASHVLLTTGTFLNGLIHIGLTHFSGGRLGDAAASKLSDSLKELGMELGRLKTGTTPRLLKSSIDFSKMEEQKGDSPLPQFSFHGDPPRMPQTSCYVTWTNSATHDAIRAGLDRSPLFTGIIEGVGARYCPSVEDKVARFPDRERHHVFVEPEGLDSNEYYVNGLSTSLPLDVQKNFLKTVPGLENAVIVRPGYGIEYDYANPVQLKPTFETRVLPGLWCAGQINGTSGYEEAAAQGMWAALNISADLKDREEFILGRDQAYMAVLADDLVTKGTNEPYRMFTSRAEYRLLLREDNADARLTPIGRKIGLVGDRQWKIFNEKQEQLARLKDLLDDTRLPLDDELINHLISMDEVVPNHSILPSELLRRPRIGIDDIKNFIPSLDGFSSEVLREAEVLVKYDGYLKRQEDTVKHADKINKMILPDGIKYEEVAGLTKEIIEKLTKIQPRNLGQAGRISGVTPAAISCLEIHLKKLERMATSAKLCK